MTRSEPRNRVRVAGVSATRNHEEIQNRTIIVRRGSAVTDPRPGIELEGNRHVERMVLQDHG